MRICLITAIIFLVSLIQSQAQNSTSTFFPADHSAFRYTGRIDFTNAKAPRFWAAGVYVQTIFKGTFCEIEVRDEVLYGNSHNYIEVSIDGKEPLRIKTSGRTNTIMLATDLPKGEHTITISKGTEALIGYLEFVGMRCEALVQSTVKTKRRIEFIGDSITSGMGSEFFVIPCDSGQWYDQHSAWFSYGAITARTLQADYHLTSESGIGMVHSCCEKPFTMPRVFNKMNLALDSIEWNFSRFQPDVVSICLGQNDGIQDSLLFTAAYVKFIQAVRKVYPTTQIICLTSPMADAQLRKVLSNYLQGIVAHSRKSGDSKIDMHIFQTSNTEGCGYHPSKQQHQQIAKELVLYLKDKMKW